MKRATSQTSTAWKALRQARAVLPEVIVLQVEEIVVDVLRGVVDAAAPVGVEVQAVAAADAVPAAVVEAGDGSKDVEVGKTKAARERSLCLFLDLLVRVHTTTSSLPQPAPTDIPIAQP